VGIKQQIQISPSVYFFFLMRSTAFLDDDQPENKPTLSPFAVGTIARNNIVAQVLKYGLQGYYLDVLAGHMETIFKEKNCCCLRPTYTCV
jgi:hypothetical protein